MNCSGRDLAGELIELEFEALISHLDPVLAPATGDEAWLTPGFIDLQVNGFAGVDYNSPVAPHEEIARSLRAQFSTGVNGAGFA